MLSYSREIMHHPSMIPNLSSSIATAKNNLTSSSSAFLIANNSLSIAANEFVILVDTIEKRFLELEEKERGLKIRGEEIITKSKELEEREARCVERERKVAQREKDVDTKIMKWEETQNQMERNTSVLQSLVRLDVRGKRFTIPKENLLKYQGSYFEAMVQTNHQQQINGEFYINRSKYLFGFISDYLSTSKLKYPKQLEDFLLLQKEFEFFNIPFPPLPVIFLAHFEVSVIKEWLPNRLTLLYKASIDGFTDTDFHRLCDNKGPTLTLIQSSEGFLFGGYSSLSWDSSSNTYQTHPDCFIFTLSNPHFIPPTKYPLKPDDKHAIFCYPGYGPTFGFGHDIYVSSGCNHNKSSYFNFPTSYVDTTGKGNNTFTGEEYFTTKDVEVYAVI